MATIKASPGGGVASPALRTLALGLLGLVLAAVLVAEVALPGAGDQDVAAATGIRPAPRLPPPGAGAVAAADHTDAWVATILSRPLFSRDRRPSTASVASATGDESLPRLTGIAVSPLGRSAIFAGAAGSKPVVVGEGATVGAYTVKAIRPDGVQVIGPGGARTIAPAFDSAPHRADAETQPLPAVPGQPALPMVPGNPLLLPGRMPLPGRPRFGEGASRAPIASDRAWSDAHGSA